MYKSTLVFFRHLLISAAITSLTACGGGGGGGDPSSDTQNLLPTSGGVYEITGGAIKGPLAYANVEIYALDARYDELYDSSDPVAVATTDSYAQIAGLTVSKSIRPPYVLVIDGNNAIDLNTGVAPVIKKLVTVISEESLAAGQAVYATPYTTLAYHMLRLDAAQQQNGNQLVNITSYYLDVLSQEIIQGLGFGLPAETNIFTTPPIINSASTNVEQQNAVVNYRAAIEGLSTLINDMSLAYEPGITTDALVEALALDLYADDVIDGAAVGEPIAGIDMDILAQNPMALTIANTNYRVQDIVALMEEESAVVGASTNVLFDTNNMAVNLGPIDAGTAVTAAARRWRWSNRRNTGSNTVSAPSTGSSASNSTAPSIPSTSTSGSGSAAITTAAPRGTVLNVNFNNHPGGAYTKQDAMRDFGANTSTEGITINNTSVVNDPSGDPARGKVMRVTHLAGKASLNGGFRFKARFPAADEYYMAFDLFIPNNYDFVGAEKLPGLMYGSLLDASHGSGVKPVAEGVKAFSVMHQLLGAEVYPNRGDGKFTSYVYDADRVQYDEFFDMVNPSNSSAGTNWHIPKGQWVRIEQRVKQNTPGKVDGILQEWVNGKLVVDKRKRFRTVNTMHIDGIYMYSFYGGNVSDPINKASKTQDEYYDNFIVSTSPITH